MHFYYKTDLNSNNKKYVFIFHSTSMFFVLKNNIDGEKSQFEFLQRNRLVAEIFILSFKSCLGF